MKIEGYLYIIHKIIPRPWGIECRFTVARPDGTHINEIVMLNDGLEDEAQIASLIVGKLKVIDVPLETLIPERIYTETEVKNLMVEKGYLIPEENLLDLKSKWDLLQVKGL